MRAEPSPDDCTNPAWRDFSIREKVSAKEEARLLEWIGSHDRREQGKSVEAPKFHPFSSREFARFRPGLFPASGFQSVQFRAIQSALGKQNLNRLRVFSPHAYDESYRRDAESVESRAIQPRMVSVASRDILRTEPACSPLLDDLAHQLLSVMADRRGAKKSGKFDSVASLDGLDKAAGELERIYTSESGKSRRKKGISPGNAERLKRFRASLDEIRRLGQKRREGFVRAVRGARFVPDDSHLAAVLRNLTAAGDALHGAKSGRSCGCIWTR